MKILKVYPAIYPLSIHQNVSIFSASLPFVAKSSHDITCISSFTPHPLNEKTHDINVIYVPKDKCLKKNIGNKILFNIDENIDTQKYRESVLEIIREKPPNLIEVEFDINLAYFLGKEIKGIPVSFVGHINTIRKNNIIKNIENIYKLSFVSGIIFVSNYFRNQLLNWMPFYKNKTYVVHNTYYHIQNNPYYKNNPSPIKKNQIIFLGRGTVRKGIKEYLESVSTLLSNKEFQSWNALAICAIEKEKEKNILDSFKEIPLVKQALETKRLTIFENIQNSEVIKHCLESKIAVFPTHPKSHQEGIPMVALEAILSKCLVISSTSGGFPEINPFPNTILNEISIDEIYGKLKYFTKNEKDLLYTQQQQCTFVKRYFSVDTLVKSYDNVRQKIVNNFYGT